MGPTEVVVYPLDSLITISVEIIMLNTHFTLDWMMIHNATRWATVTVVMQGACRGRGARCKSTLQFKD